MNPLTTPKENRLSVYALPGAILLATKPPSPLRGDHSASSMRDGNRHAMRLGHVHLRVRELKRAMHFYREILGLRLTECVGRFAFLAAGNEHHCVALEETGPWASHPPRRASGVAHIAFELAGPAVLATLRRALLAAGVPFISRNNGISWAIRFNDPDRNEVEAYIDRRHTSTGTYLWEGRWHKPSHIEDEIAPTRQVAAS